MDKIKIELKWAIYFTLMTLAWMYFEKLMGWHAEKIELHPIYTNLFAIPAILFCTLAIKEKKKNYFNGKMSWGEGMKTGLILTAFIALLSPIGQIITHLYISPEYFPNAIAYSVETGKVSQTEAENFFTLSSYTLQSAIGAVVMGLITSAIVSLFLKTKSEQAASNN